MAGHRFKTSFLGQDTALAGPSQAGPRLPQPQAVVVRMNQVRETQKAQAAGQGWWRKEPSPFALRMGYKQNLDALHTNAIS